VSTVPQLSPEAVAQALTTLGVPADKAAAAAAQGAAWGGLTVSLKEPPPPHARPETVIAWARSVNPPEPVPEYAFHPTRKWRADYFFPPSVLLDIEGVANHATRKGLRRDIDKANAGQLLGFVFLRCVPKQLFTHGTAMLIREALALQTIRREALARPQP
jgi:hypothetical protein